MPRSARLDSPAREWGTFYIPLVKNFFNRCYYSLLRFHPGDWAHFTTRYFEGSASFSPFGELTA